MCLRCKDSGWLLADKKRWVESWSDSEQKMVGRWSDHEYTFAKRCECFGRPSVALVSGQRFEARREPPRSPTDEPAKPSKQPMREKYGERRIDKRAELPEDWF